MKPESGQVYFLKDYTAPKVFNGLYFECLLTDQKIPANAKIKMHLGSFQGYPDTIWKPERFNKSLKNQEEDLKQKINRVLLSHKLDGKLTEKEALVEISRFTA